MNIITWSLINVIVPIVVSLTTVLLTMYFKKSEKSPKLLLTYSKLNGNKSKAKEKLIENYWNMKKELDEDLKNYLKEKNYYATYYMDRLLEDTVKIYKNRNHLKKDYFKNDRSVQICKMINEFKNDNEFMSHIKKYEVYFDNSNWDLKILNIGNVTSYDFCITSLDKEIISSKNLDVKEYVMLNLKYFDQSIRINTFDFGGYSRFQFGFSKHKSISFYLVKKRRYNKKDEIIFKLSYQDNYLKLREFYCCSKIKIIK